MPRFPSSEDNCGIRCQHTDSPAAAAARRGFETGRENPLPLKEAIMPVSWRSPRVHYAALLAAVLLGCAAGPLQAQQTVAFGKRASDYCPPAPCVTGDG